MILPIVFLLSFGVLPRQELDDTVRRHFTIAAAQSILQPEGLGPQARRIAERITSHVSRRSNRAFVAEDGKAVGIQVGTVDKMGIDPPGLLTEGDRYRLLIAGKEMIPYNVSQETYLRFSTKTTPSIPLKPLVLLDKYRTLCANGDPGAREYRNAPPRALLLAIVDDRQRGARPNVARTIIMPKDVGFPYVVGSHGDWYFLAIGQGGKRASYLEVNGRTLRTRPGNPRLGQEYWRDMENVQKVHGETGFVSHSYTPWNGRSYFIASVRNKEGRMEEPASYAWEDNRLTRIDPWAIVGASFNGKYGWLLNRQTGQSWLITRK